KFNFELSGLEDFNFPKNQFDLVSAQRVLPFLQSKESLVKVFEKIKISLKPNGIFAGHFFGPNDTWCKEKREMTFVTESEIRELLKDMEITKLQEFERDSQTATGTPHHWHIFDVIAGKK
ncbi:MAG TPA: class I SAM-dependent methyltransferase, partial [Candidatus Paceibacterota bacterium]|nr:class I SAM-dependent methyltransferase [Candidatus Paceibacterota bacterium]